MKIIENISLFNKLHKDTSYLIFFLVIIIFLGYVVPTIVFLSPAGTDVYSHMSNTLQMVETNSLFEFYEKSFVSEDLSYDYPFGLWLFGSIILKITALDIYQLVYIVPLILAFILVYLYYIYSYKLVFSENKSILTTIFLISMPLMTLNILQYATGRFVSIFLITILYMSLFRFSLKSVFIILFISFSLVFTHTGTFMFLMFFSITYFLLFALLWKKFDNGIFILIIGLLTVYVMSVNIFPYIQPQYIDKARMILTISDSISQKLGLVIIKELGIIFYEKIFVENSILYIVLLSSPLFFAGKLFIFIHSKLENISKNNRLAIPLIGNIKNVAHGIETTPFWMGPLHTFLSIFGFFKLDEKGKCIAFSLALTALFPGALQSGENTGSLREIYYLFLIIPITSTTGFYYIYDYINTKSPNAKTKNVIILIYILIMLPLIAAPIVANLYYSPTISGTQNEKENLIWLSKIGNSQEGAAGSAYRERIELYGDKLTPSIPNGNPTRRFLNDLKYIYFIPGGENYADDIYSFNIKYIISSDRTINSYREKTDSLKIDSNKRLDKIYSSNNNFSIYNYIIPAANLNTSGLEELELELNKTYPKIQMLGSTYLIDNDYYKIKLSKISPEIVYIGTKIINLAPENGFNDQIRISWTGPYMGRYVVFNLKNLKYSYVSINDNKIVYKTLVKDEKNLENWAILIVKYTFYEKVIKREIDIANDWVSLDDEQKMNIDFTSSIFSPMNDFEFNQIEKYEEKNKFKKIYPSQDAVVFKDKKFNTIYFNESGTGLFIKYSDLSPYPTRLSYMGSTLYDYGIVSMSNIFSLSPAESIALIQYFSIGDRFTSENNVVQLSSVTPYNYQEAKIPVILTGHQDEEYEKKYFLNSYDIMKNNNIIFNDGITSKTKTSLNNEFNPIGYVNIYDKNLYMNFSNQNEIIRNVKGNLELNGVLFSAFKYNLNSIKVLSDNNIEFAEALKVPSPFMGFFTEGLRHPKMAYYKGDKTGVVLIPVTLPASSVLSTEYDNEKVFAQWKETLDSVVEDGGIAAFDWNLNDIGNPDYSSKFIDIINYSKSKGMSTTTPNEVAAHYKLLQKISTIATKGVDYVVLNSTNHNQGDVTGITYKLEMPLLNNSCPYTVSNGRIPRQEIKDGNCRLFVSFDLKPGDQKEIKVELNVTRKTFDLDLSDLFEGESRIIIIKDNEGNEVDKASIYVDSRWFESNQNGSVKLSIRRGIHNIKVEKPGFVSREGQIEVKGRIYRVFNLFNNDIQMKRNEPDEIMQVKKNGSEQNAT